MTRIFATGSVDFLSARHSNRRWFPLTSVSSIVVTAFDGGQAGWKLDADGKVEMKDGNPVYINSAGQEQTVQGDTISRLNGEAKTFRERAEKAEKALEPFKGIDPEKASKAIETVGKLDAKQLIDAGEVDKVRDSMKAEFTGQLTEKDAKIAELSGSLDNMHIDRIFDSEFVTEQVATPRDMFADSMRKHFKRENGETVAYDRSGNRLMSKAHNGEYAKPDEALQLLVDMHPQKDSILRAPAAGGSGNGGGGGQRGGGRTIKRADFDAMHPTQQAEMATKMGAGEVTITD